MEETEKLIGLAAHELERRGMPRCPVDEEVTLVVPSGGSTIRGRMLELSASGCRMVLREELPRGIHLAVEVSFRVHGIAFRLGGLTEWTSGSKTVGVSFGPMSARRRDDLLEVLCEVGAEQAAKSSGDRAGAAAKSPADEESGLRPAMQPDAPGAATTETFRLLDAVFPKTQSAAATEHAGNRAQGSEPAGANRSAAKTPCAEGKTPAILARAPLAVEGAMAKSAAPSGESVRTSPMAKADSSVRTPSAAQRERRVEARCGVDTSAGIHLVKGGTRLSGQIRDLSLGGCRIRTREKFPVGIYTRVEVEFRLQGTALLLGGVVQAIHGRNDVGIRFLDVSPRKREHLAELIAEIKEMQGSPDRG
jgi:c-di-GMP-binding flagellar brake protein YcgR